MFILFVKFSRGYVYSRIIQGGTFIVFAKCSSAYLGLFKGVRLFRTLEYALKTIYKK
jgi:hypothetical protein